MKSLRERMQDVMDDYTDSIVWVDVPLQKWDESEHPRGKTTEASNEGSFTFASRASLVPELRREYRELAARSGQDSSTQDDERFLALGARIREVERDWAERMTAAVSSGVLTLEQATALGFNDPQNGTPLKPLPLDLWHVTTAAPAIGASRLKTQHELGRDFTPGLGGGMDHVLSFTDSEEYANLIRDTLVLARQVARGEVTLAQLEAQAQQGVGGSQPFQQRLHDFIGGGYQYGLRGLTNVGVFDAHRYGIKYTSGVPELPSGWEKIDNYNLLRPMTEEEKFSFTETYFKAWLAARGEAGGPENPLIAFNDWRKLAALPEDAIGVVRVVPSPNSMGWHYPWEHEYRTHPSAVRVAEIRKGEHGWDEAEHPRGKTTEASNEGSFTFKNGGRGSVRLNEANQKSARDNLEKAIKTLGVKPEVVDKAKKQLQDLMKTARIAINRSSAESVTDLFIGSGRMKTQFETGTSSGLNNKTRRAEIEHTLFGIENDRMHDPENRPVYGYLIDEAHTPYDINYEGTGQYGNFRFVLKPEVRDRTTWTEDDSLVEDGLYKHTPSAVSNPELYTLVQESTLLYALRSGDPKRLADELFGLGGADSIFKRSLLDYMINSYLEAQVHGQVRKEDIAQLHVGKKLYESLEDDVKDEIARLGIPVIFHDAGDLDGYGGW